MPVKTMAKRAIIMLAKCNGRIYHVTFTMRGEMFWIISARKANEREQRRYEKV